MTEEIWLLKIYGVVQGVCYRSFVCGFVHGHTSSISGYVKNLPDGTVEVLAKGEVHQLEDLISACRKGPRDSRVDKIDLNKYTSVKDYPGIIPKYFDIDY